MYAAQAHSTCVTLHRTPTQYQYWFPIRDLDNMKLANLSGALNLELDGNKAVVQVNTTSPQEDALVLLNARGKSLLKKKVNIMTFRHTFATHMYEAKVPIRDIQEMMGHTDRTETTVYIHVTIDFVKRLFENHVYNTMGMDEV